MSAPKYIQDHRPRELRRRVVIPARLRNGAQWSDTCILNISSRGLMIHSGRAAPKGSVVELRRGDFVIIARVMWRDGGRVGLQSDERLPIEEILSVSQSKALQLVAADGARIDRRRKPRRRSSDARLRGRAYEFIGTGIIVLGLALSVWAMAEQAFARPLAQISAALGG
jgi:hypothetical protein